MVELIKPHGGELVNRVLAGEAGELALARARKLPKVVMGTKELSDLELIAVGAFSPLKGFMGMDDYASVLDNMRLSNGLVWTIPITLPVSSEQAKGLEIGREVALTNETGDIFGVLGLAEKYNYNREKEARLVYRTTDTAHPGVARLMAQGDVLLAGEIYLLNRPVPEFPEFHLDPAGIRAIIREKGWKSMVGFQTRNPVHRAHEYIQKCALEMLDGLLLQPLVGETKTDDIPPGIRMRSYQVLLEGYYPKDRTMLAVLPAAMRYAGPREAVFHALVRKNYGCTHFIVGRDHAGVGSYYGTYDAQLIFDEFAPEEIDITPLFFEHTFYCKACGNMASNKTCPHPAEARLTLSGTKVREMLGQGAVLPGEFTRPEVARVLSEGLSQGKSDRSFRERL